MTNQHREAMRKRYQWQLEAKTRQRRQLYTEIGMLREAIEKLDADGGIDAGTVKFEKDGRHDQQH